MKTIPVIGTLALSLAATAVINAEVIAWDTFETASAGALNGKGGGSGWTANWTADSSTQIVSKSMSYSSGDISLSGGDQAILGGPASGSFSGSRTFSTTTEGVVYMSFLFERIGDLTGDVLDFNLGDNPNNYRPSAGVDVRDVFNNSMYAANGGGIIRGSTGVSVTDSTALVVARLTNGADGYTTLDVLINPSTTTEPASGWHNTTITLSDGETMMDSLNAFLIRNVNLDAGDGFYMDNLTIATSYTDVVSQIPEPSTYALIGGVIALGIVMRNRRNQARK
ncbi:MAG: PEP-CTERM sorting domain-containing protein [Puniceicoccales bacterium]